MNKDFYYVFSKLSDYISIFGKSWMVVLVIGVALYILGAFAIFKLSKKVELKAPFISFDEIPESEISNEKGSDIESEELFKLDEENFTSGEKFIFVVESSNSAFMFPEESDKFSPFSIKLS